MKNKFNTMLLALVLCMGAFLMPVKAHAQGAPEAEEPAPASASVDPEAEREPVPFTPEGQASVVDHATDGDGKEFYTFSTPEGNIFYLVIDSQRESDNVYFLNAVTEADLMALAESDGGEGSTGVSAIPEIKACTCKGQCTEGWADVSCPVCKENPAECKGKAAQGNPPEEGNDGEGKEPEEGQSTGKSAGNSGTIVFILLAAAAAGGAGYYLKIYKPRHDLDDAEDLDELLGDGGDVQEINEDEEAGSGGRTAWDQGRQPDRETAWEAAATAEETEETGGRETGAGEDAALYDDYPEDDYPDGPDDMQEG